MIQLYCELLFRAGQPEKWNGDDQEVSTEWILLIYSLPSQPSRKRAYVWRELKKLGAIYLRDGVALLPRTQESEGRLAEVAERIAAYDGSAELVLAPRFLNEDPARFVERFQADRTDEYRELYHECVHFMRDVLEEVDAKDFGFPDVDKLESELGRLHRWKEQIAERDYFRAPGVDRVDEILGKCDHAFDAFVNDASQRDAEPVKDEPDDVYERLGGPAEGMKEGAEELPL